MMAWNEPGSNKSDEDNSSNSNNKKQFTGRHNQNYNGPPDLEKVFSNLYKKFLSWFGDKTRNFGNNSGDKRFDFLNNKNNVVIFIILSILGLIYLIIGFYIVHPAEQAVVTRFGKFNRINGPGPHWIPKFIENYILINSEQVGSSRHSGSMLTKDENIVFVEIEVQYRIFDVDNYLFQVAEPIKTLKQAAESALRQVVGHANLDFIMTEGRTQISEDIKQQLSNILEEYKVGIQVITVAFKEAKAPEAVKSAFDDVIKAREEQERLKHAAEAFANKIVPEAEGDAKRMLVEAEGYRKEVIAKATGDILRFNLVLFEYNKAPDITRKRLYLDTLEEILSNTNKVIVDLKQSNNLIYLPLDKLIASNNNNKNVIKEIKEKEVVNEN